MTSSVVAPTAHIRGPDARAFPHSGFSIGASAAVVKTVVFISMVRLIGQQPRHRTGRFRVRGQLPIDLIGEAEGKYHEGGRATATPSPLVTTLTPWLVGWSNMSWRSPDTPWNRACLFVAVVISAETTAQKRKTLLPPHKGEPRLRTLTGPLYAVAFRKSW
jgi:hypothetical protein